MADSDNGQIVDGNQLLATPSLHHFYECSFPSLFVALHRLRLDEREREGREKQAKRENGNKSEWEKGRRSSAAGDFEGKGVVAIAVDAVVGSTVNHCTITAMFFATLICADISTRSAMLLLLLDYLMQLLVFPSLCTAVFGKMQGSDEFAEILGIGEAFWKKQLLGCSSCILIFLIKSC
ncbi:hypothetical protein Nepgr_016306 [Nepenthes gracilis]|uniref:Uncharacterized protein n=1 Tax=Nepenthes gracilis TaxID=150966 RepID=A0AAD3SMH2_NEPGR|nr:hypothetical protein Nepgr_016306 [Nepenthes gracilis]